MKKYTSLSRKKNILVNLQKQSQIMKMTGGNMKYIHAVSHTPADQRARHQSSRGFILFHMF